MEIETTMSKLWELVMDREAQRAAIHGVTKSRTRLSNCTELKLKKKKSCPRAEKGQLFRAQIQNSN